MPSLASLPLVTPAEVFAALYPEPKSLLYEKAIADLEERFASSIVKRDHHLIGRYSGIRRQVDVWIEGHVGSHAIKVAIDCKCYRRPVGLKTVDAFIGMLDDVGADKGVLVSTSGFTPGATRRAAAKNIEVQTISFEELDEFNFADYVGTSCQESGCHWGEVRWNEMLSGDAGNPTPPKHLAGECCQCGTLHIECGNCGTVDAYANWNSSEPIVKCSGCSARWGLELEKNYVVGFEELECWDDDAADDE